MQTPRLDPAPGGGALTCRFGPWFNSGGLNRHHYTPGSIPGKREVLPRGGKTNEKDPRGGSRKTPAGAHESKTPPGARDREEGDWEFEVYTWCEIARYRSLSLELAELVQTLRVDPAPGALI